jgi:tetratricopeptide (TPR) repeat protein
MRAHRLAATLASVLSIVAVTNSAWSQTPSPSPEPSPSPAPPPVVPTAAQQEALIRYERGRAYYAAGRYRMAVVELEAAAQLDPLGYNLYFDLGLVYERLGEVDQASVAYRRYLEHISDPVERERAERIVVRLRGARAELGDVHRGHGDADGWFWLTAALSIGALGVGTTLLVTAHSADNTPRTAGEVFLVGGGALAVTAALLYFARLAPPQHTPHCVTAGVGLREVMVGVTF